MFAEDLHEDTPQLTTSGGCQPCNNGFIHVGYDVLNVQIYGTDNNLLTSWIALLCGNAVVHFLQRDIF